MDVAENVDYYSQTEQVIDNGNNMEDQAGEVNAPDLSADERSLDSTIESETNILQHVRRSTRDPSLSMVDRVDVNKLVSTVCLL